MGKFVDLFRPKWKHSDAGVRASAVKDMGAEAAEALIAIARQDSDAAVRRIAIKKLTDPELLQELARNDPDESLRQMAGERALELLRGLAMQENLERALPALERIREDHVLAEICRQAPLEPIRLAALDRLTDDRSIAEVARSSGDHAFRLRALGRIRDTAVLRGLAMGDDRKEFCLAALERLKDPADLDAISQKGRNKAVRAQAKRRLAELKAREAPPEAPAPTDTAQKQLHARMVQLCAVAERLCQSDQWAEAEAELAALRAEWEGLSAEGEEELQRRFRIAQESFVQRRENHRVQREIQEKRIRELSANLETRLSILARLEGAQPGSETEALVAEARQAWASAGEVPQNRRQELETRFQKALASLVREKQRTEAARSALERLQQIVTEAEDLMAPGRGREAGARLQELMARFKELADQVKPEEHQPLGERLDKVGQALAEQENLARAQREQRQKENQERLEAALADMERVLEKGDLQGLERQLKMAQGRFRKPGPLPSKEAHEELMTRFNALRERLLALRQELREADEWKRWANIPKLEQLCVEMEGLEKLENPQELSRRLRDLQGRWKQVGPVPKEKAEPLWARFKAASDQVYARCQEHFSRLEDERRQNLTKKESLCEKVEALVESSDWTATAEAIKGFQKEWKEIGPVPRAQSDAIWKRFRKACDAFFDRRQEHLDQQNSKRLDNLAQKEALCQEVEALAESTDWEATAEAIKGIQGRWRRFGPVPRAQSDAIWKRFRKACDAFFDRRDAHIQGLRTENLKAREQICIELEDLAGSLEWEAEPDLAALSQRTMDLYSRWKASGPPPQEQAAATWERFVAAWERIARDRPELFKGTELDAEANVHRKERLCQRALDLAGPEISAGDPAEAIADRLRNALAANTFSEPTESPMVSGGRRVRDEVRQLQQAWRRVGPVYLADEKLLGERFENACSRALAKWETAEERSASAEEARGDNLSRKQAIVDRAEALAGSDDKVAAREAIKKLQKEWKSVGPVPRVKARTLWNRFRRACKVVLSDGPADNREPEAAEDEPAEPADETRSEPGMPDQSAP